MFNRNKAFEIPDDGLLLENGSHLISGSGVPVHSVTGPTVYFRTNNTIYFNDGIGSGWVLQSAGTAETYQKYFVATAETYTIPQGVSSVVTGPLEFEGIIELNGRLEVI
jgi:hypothetical protein